MTPPAPIDSGFVQNEFADAYPPGIERHYWNHARNRIVRRLLARLMTTPGPILEIGCGTGIVTDFLRRAGLDCTGCDIGVAPPMSERVAPFLRLGTDAFELPADERAAVRYLLMLDVLEHIERPREFLSRCRERFTGLLGVLVSVPARMEVWSNYDEYYRHYRRYDHRTIAELYDAREFALERSGYLFHALYPPARLLKLLGRQRQTKLAAPGLPALHALVAACFDIEQRIVPASWPGTSIYAALRPRD